MIRIAAVGDIHMSKEARGSLRPHVAALKDHVDALLLAGDLTYVGRLEEAEVLAGERRGGRGARERAAGAVEGGGRAVSRAGAAGTTAA